MALKPFNANAGIEDDKYLSAYNKPPGGAAPEIKPSLGGTVNQFVPQKQVAPTQSGPDYAAIAAGLEDARQKALKIQDEVNKLSKNQEPATPVTKIVSSSEPVVNDENDTKNEIANLSVPSIAELEAKAASENYLKVLDDEAKRLEERRKAEIAALEQQFAGAKTSLEGEQKKEQGTTNVALMRAGGFLGTQISGVGVLNNLAATHRSEIAALESKKAAAIAAANAAVDEKLFNVAKLKAQEAKDLSKDINDRRNKFFDQTMEIVKEQRTQFEKDEARRNTIRDDARASLSTIINSFGGIDFEALDAVSLQQLQELSIAAEIPLDLLKGPTLAEQSQQNTERQRQISNSISLANLSLSKKRLEQDTQISPTDAKNLNLPRALVGMSEEELEAQFQEDIPPEWFVEFKLDKGELTQDSTAAEAEAQWKKFKNEVVKTSSLIDFGGGFIPVDPEAAGE